MTLQDSFLAQSRLIVVREGEIADVLSRLRPLSLPTVLRADDGAPPRSGDGFWMRLIAQMHSRGMIGDDTLVETITAVHGDPSSRREQLRRAFGAVDVAVVIVVDPAVGDAGPDGGWGSVITELLAVLDAHPHVAAIVRETDDVVVDLDAASRIRPVRLAHASDAARIPSISETKPASLQDAIRDAAGLRDAAALAIPDSVDVELATMLTQRSDPRALLEALVVADLGAWTEDDHGGLTFTYRETIRRDALDLLRRRWPERRVALSQDVASWHLRRGDQRRAFLFAIDAEDVALVEYLGLRLFPFALTLQEDVFDRIVALPRRRIHESVFLANWVGTRLSHSTLPHLDPREYFDAVVEAAGRLPEDVADTERLVLLGIETYALRRLGLATREHATAKRFAREAHRLYEADALDDELAHAFADFAFQTGVSLMVNGDRDASLDLLELVSDFCTRHGILHRRNSVRALQALILSLEGRTHQSLAFSQQVSDDDWPTVWWGGDLRAKDKVAGLVRAIVTGDLCEVSRTVGAVQESAIGIENWDIPLFGRILADLANGHAGTARSTFAIASRDHLNRPPHPAVARRLRVYSLTFELLGEGPLPVISSRIGREDGAVPLALRAALDLDHRRVESAARRLAKARRAASTPLQHHLVLIADARLAHAMANEEALASAATELTTLVETHELRIGFVLMSPSERAALLAASASASLRDAIEMVAVLRAHPSRRSDLALTRQQITVLAALAEYGDRREVARRLFLSPATVKAHLRAIYRKLDARSETDAIARAAAAGLLLIAPRGDERDPR